MVVFRLINGVITPPAVSKPRVKGATSNNNNSSNFSSDLPERMAA